MGGAGYCAVYASSTFPGIPPFLVYPDEMKTIPLTTTAPGPSIEPPRPRILLMVSNSRAVLKSQMTRPSSAAWARMCPSVDVANTAPGIAVTAPGCDGLQPAGASLGQGAAEACQSLLPSAILRAVNPPPCRGSRTNRRVSKVLEVVRVRPTSDTAAYTRWPSKAIPHCTPPFVPPRPTRVRHRISPFFSGSSAYTMPDFCPASRTSPAVGETARIAEDAKSKSGPASSGQFRRSPPHELL